MKLPEWQRPYTACKTKAEAFALGIKAGEQIAALTRNPADKYHINEDGDIVSAKTGLPPQPDDYAIIFDTDDEETNRQLEIWQGSKRCQP